MKILPIDIKQKKFSITMRGYSKDEVLEYLSEVANSFESLIEDNSNKIKKIGNLKNDLKHFKNIEQTLKKTLVTAQQIKDDMQLSSKKEADLVIAEAKLKASEIVSHAKKDFEKYQREIEELKRERIIFKNKLTNLLDSHKELLRTFEE